MTPSLKFVLSSSSFRSNMLIKCLALWSKLNWLNLKLQPIFQLWKSSMSQRCHSWSLWWWQARSCWGSRAGGSSGSWTGWWWLTTPSNNSSRRMRVSLTISTWWSREHQTRILNNETIGSLTNVTSLCDDSMGAN